MRIAEADKFTHRRMGMSHGRETNLPSVHMQPGLKTDTVW